MKMNKVMGSLLVLGLGLGIADGAVVENIKASADGAKKFAVVPKIINLDGKKVFATTPKSYITYSLKQKIKIDPAKKYRVSAKVKQLGDKPAYLYIGFIPYDAQGRVIDPKHGFNNIKGSMTSLSSNAAKGAKSITVKDASKWQKGSHFYVAFNVKEDLSDIPNFNLSEMIEKIEKNGDLYTISFKKPLPKVYPAGTAVRQHRSGGSYIYTKNGDAPKDWAVWKGFTVQGKILRKATFISPMIMINARKADSGAVFTDFIVEAL
ncbi:MAG: hypothetical protein L3J71_13575 [Victivallaceae bacterium]|nr:hypothetical protein [Victivallaceae bacterium]